MKKRTIAGLGLGFVLIACSLATRFVLRNTNEIASNNMLGAVGNQAYVGEHGHKEAVFDTAGKLVEDCVKMGSYNYYNQRTSPYSHFFVDSLPWIILGNYRNDPTTFAERLMAYLVDFRAGIKRTYFEK